MLNYDSLGILKNYLTMGTINNQSEYLIPLLKSIVIAVKFN